MHTENIEIHSDWHWIPPGSVGAHSHGRAGWQPCALSCTPYEPDVWSSMDKQELWASNTVQGEGCHKACTLRVSCPWQNNSHGWVVGKKLRLYVCIRWDQGLEEQDQSWFGVCRMSCSHIHAAVDRKTCEKLYLYLAQIQICYFTDRDFGDQKQGSLNYLSPLSLQCQCRLLFTV